LANHILGAQLKELNFEKSDLISKLARLEVGIPISRKKQRRYPRAIVVKSMRKKDVLDDQQLISHGTTNAKLRVALNLTGKSEAI
jgi:hypothetical protein